ncbi:hypothetical protein [Subtercola boreus]|uniref:hypothetical protein n=1 Tax=Subtercola boreus TaxID=120213 RepID=UPI0011C07F7E|nr:hypothetical protein [Subtercola boreus]
MDDQPGTTGDRRTTRRSFLIVSGTALATAAVGAVTGLTVNAVTGGALFREPSVQSDAEPTLAKLSGTDDDAAGELIDFLKSAGRAATIDGQYFIDSPIIVPDTLRHLTLAAGSALKVRGDHSGIARSGAIKLREKTKGAMKEGASSFTATDPGLYTADEWLLLSGANTVKNSKDKYGYLRRVTSIDGRTINIDRPLPRTINKGPRTSAVTLSPSLEIDGAGEVFNVDPKNAKKSLVTLFAVENPVVSGIEVHSNGGIGVTVAHCHGGHIDCTVRDLLDDGENYFGYAVNISGSSRDVVVNGFMTRVRHAVTTNAGGLIQGVGNAGEPEDCTFAPTARDCSNKAVDTHRLGWGITMIPNVIGGNGAVQVRADNVSVVGGSVSGVTVSGITVSADVVVPARITGVNISDVTQGTGIRARGPAEITDCLISDTPGTAVELASGSSIDGLEIRNGGSIGVRVLGNNNSVAGVRAGSATTTVVQLAPGKKGNSVVPNQGVPFLFAPLK